MRVHKLMDLYQKHVRPRFLKLNKEAELDPEDPSLTFFLNNHGKRYQSIEQQSQTCGPLEGPMWPVNIRKK